MQLRSASRAAKKQASPAAQEKRPAKESQTQTKLQVPSTPIAAQKPEKKPASNIAPKTRKSNAVKTGVYKGPIPANKAKEITRQSIHSPFPEKLRCCGEMSVPSISL